MVAGFARGSAVVVAAAAVGRCCERAVIHLGTAPGAVGFVAALTLRHTGVGGIVGLGGLTKS